MECYKGRNSHVSWWQQNSKQFFSVSVLKHISIHMKYKKNAFKETYTFQNTGQA